MVPELNGEFGDGEISFYRQPSLTWKLADDALGSKTDRLDAVKQAIYHILCTERYSNPIYDDNYGIELEQYIGAEFGKIKAGIENTLSDALTQDDRVLNVTVNDIVKEKDFCNVRFTVRTIYGEMEGNVNVLQ
jgi:phage baseplate assembly protein W